MTDTIVFNEVNKKLGDFQLQNVNFKVKKGHITGFIGPNGAGKTTVIKLIMNLMKPDQGDIRVFDEKIDSDPKGIKQRIGFVYADNNFYDHLNLEKIKSVIAPFYNHWDDDVFYHYIKKFKLPLKKKTKNFSTGMRMKLSLAIALSHDADLILLDEPTSGLDPIFRANFLEYLKDIIQDEEKTVFFSSHIISDLEQIADYVICIDDGQIIFNSRKDYLLDSYYFLTGPNSALNAFNKENLIGLRESAFNFKALTNDQEEIDKATHHKVSVRQATLEEIIIYTIGDELL